MGFSIVCQCVYSSVVSVHLGEGGLGSSMMKIISASSATDCQ